MELICHGGKCCGVRHIYSMGDSPSDECPPIDKIYDLFKNSIGAGEYHNPGSRFFIHAAPREAGWRRLDRYLKYCDERRPEGVVEVILNQATPWDPYGPQQNKAWRKSLLKRGFKEVNKCLNSNSGNMLHIYHRNSGEVPVKKGKNEVKAVPVENDCPF